MDLKSDAIDETPGTLNAGSWLVVKIPPPSHVIPRNSEKLLEEQCALFIPSSHLAKVIAELVV